MPNPDILVFKGPGSWTGKATISYFGEGVEQAIRPADSFEDVLGEAKSGVLGVLPIWNIHEGEIQKTENRKDDIIKFSHEHGVAFNGFWPYWIDFVCLGRIGKAEDAIKRVTSVDVAEAQCSNYLGKLKGQSGAEFVLALSTVDAAKKLDNDGSIDAFLGGIHQHDATKHIVLNQDVSNKLNFTTFVLLGNPDMAAWDGQWEGIKSKCLPYVCRYSSAEMPSFGSNLSDEHHEFFSHLFSDVADLSQIPKVIFVSESEYKDRLFLVLEYASIDGEAIELATASHEIRVRSNAGGAPHFYGDILKRHIAQREAGLLEMDFVKFSGGGGESYFFACPPLGIFMHGFDERITEEVFRRAVANYFDAYANGVEATDRGQKAFLESNKAAYQLEGYRFYIIKDYA